MRQKIRMIVQLLFFLSFPVTINWFSPYVIVDGALQGIATGSFILFITLLVSSLFLGRLFCSWVCPASFLQDTIARSRTKKFNGRIRNLIKWFIWFPWLSFIIFAFFQSGGISEVRPLHLMESGISIDEGAKYIIYYGIVFLFFGLAFLGKRAACHSICWMAPFMILSTSLSRLLRLPRFHLEADTAKCSACGTCNAVCPMSLNVQALVRENRIDNNECILCARCVDSCSRKVIKIGFK